MPPADWYDDPDTPGALRWWDGQGWTSFMAIAADWPEVNPPPPPPLDEQIRFADVRSRPSEPRTPVQEIRFDDPSP
jgi:hypothetical protein